MKICLITFERQVHPEPTPALMARWAVQSYYWLSTVSYTTTTKLLIIDSTAFLYHPAITAILVDLLASTGI
jgi:hypothetical protein